MYISRKVDGSRHGSRACSGSVPRIHQTYKAIIAATSAPTTAPTQSPTAEPARVPFYKPPGADWTQTQYYDKITDDVWLTRQDEGPVYNYKV